MKKKLTRQNWITATFIVVVLFVSIAWSLQAYRSESNHKTSNEIRLLLSEQLDAIEKGEFYQGKYPYIVYDLTGCVLYSVEPFTYRKNDFINVQELLQRDESFYQQYPSYEKECFVLKENATVYGFVTFLIPEIELTRVSVVQRVVNVFAPLIFGAVLIVITLLYQLWYSNRRILLPMREISESAKAIIKGNYDLEVIRVYNRSVADNEIGELTYSFELMRDELKSKQIREEELKKSQQELMSCISHDLKTPIATIQAYAEGIRDGIAKNEQDRNKYIEVILQKTSTLISMIKNLLAVSNAQLNQLEIKKEELYFNPYFVTLMEEVELYIRQNDMELTYERLPYDCLVQMDTRRITEVIYNLVENSIKYRGEKGKRIAIQARVVEEDIQVQVKDDGMGIQSDDIPYVFDRFYRAEKSRSSRIVGSGLGLSICKYIVEQHGGTVYCKSQKSGGCEIGFTIPIL